MICKRYTDFVKLHDALNIAFKTQIDNNNWISATDKILPVLPSKISKQKESDLNLRKQQLQVYLQEVINLLSGQAQFNESLLNFLAFQPYAQTAKEPCFGSEPSSKFQDYLCDGITSEFFDIHKFNLTSYSTKIVMLS